MVKESLDVTSQEDDGGIDEIQDKKTVKTRIQVVTS